MKRGVPPVMLGWLSPLAKKQPHVSMIRLRVLTFLLPRSRLVGPGPASLSPINGPGST